MFDAAPVAFVFEFAYTDGEGTAPSQVGRLPRPRLPSCAQTRLSHCETANCLRDKMKKILVIGCPGSGKSTFARGLNSITGIPLYYLDMLWHQPDGTNLAREAFDAALVEILAEDRWIVDGNYPRTLPMRLAKCDTVFLFDIPVAECLTGAEKRIGMPRADMPWVEETFSDEFRRYIQDFPTEQFPGIYRALHECPQIDKVIFRSRTEADAYLHALPRAECADNGKNLICIP